MSAEQSRDGGRPEVSSDRPETASTGVRSPWVRTRLRTAPLAALLSAVLAFAAVFLATALPRTLDRSADRALRAYLDRASPASTQLQIMAAPTLASSQARAQDLDNQYSVLRGLLGPDLPLDARNAAYGERGGAARVLTDPGLAEPSGLPPQLDLLYLAHATDHLRLLSGRWPGVAPASGRVLTVQVALSGAAASTLGVHLGQMLDTPSFSGISMRAQVVGLYAATDPSGRYWSGAPCFAQACLKTPNGSTAADPPTFWAATGLVGANAAGVVGPWSGEKAMDFWWLPVATDSLRADTLPGTRREVTSWMNGPTQELATQITSRDDLAVYSGLPELLDAALARQAAVQPLTAVGPAGLAGVVLVVLCLAAGLTAERRAAELHLLRARGGSRRGLVLRLLGESACTVLPAAVLATVLALELLPSPRWGGAVLAAVVTSLPALLAVPALTLARDALRLRSATRRKGRRLVAELALLAAAVGAVAEVRQRGVVGLDPLLVAAPLLLAAVGAVLLARSQPLVVGALARAAARGSGAIGFLGLARAASGNGQRGRVSLLPLLALTLAVTTAGFGAATLQSVDDSRVGATRLMVGGDLSVVAPSDAALAPSVVRVLDALPGVSVGSAFWEQDQVGVTADGGPVVTALLAVDPGTYARLAGTVGRGAFDPAQLTSRPVDASAPLPALVTSDLAPFTSPDHPFGLRLGDNSLLRVAGVGQISGTPALVDSAASVVVVPIGPASARLPQIGHPNHWLGLGSTSEAQLRSAAPNGFHVDTASAHMAALVNDPLQASATRIFWDCSVATWCFALLAVLLALLRAGPERAALLARLRTMGLRPRQGLRLILTEALPQSLTAALGGGLTAAAAVLLLGPAIDVSPLVGVQVQPGLAFTVPPLLAQTLIVAGLAVLAVVAEAAVQGRRQITIELRAGDGR